MVRCNFAEVMAYKLCILCAELSDRFACESSTRKIDHTTALVFVCDSAFLFIAKWNRSKACFLRQKAPFTSANVQTKDVLEILERDYSYHTTRSVTIEQKLCFCVSA